MASWASSRWLLSGSASASAYGLGDDVDHSRSTFDAGLTVTASAYAVGLTGGSARAEPSQNREGGTQNRHHKGPHAASTHRGRRSSRRHPLASALQGATPSALTTAGGRTAAQLAAGGTLGSVSQSTFPMVQTGRVRKSKTPMRYSTRSKRSSRGTHTPPPQRFGRPSWRVRQFPRHRGSRRVCAGCCSRSTGSSAGDSAWSARSRQDGPLASSATGASVAHGLTPRGRDFCERIYARGALVDVSHVSDASFADIAAIARTFDAPVVATHSNARAVAGHPRNLTDAQLQAIGNTGGVAGVNLHSPYVNGTGASPINDVVKQIEHMVRRAGLGAPWPSVRISTAGSRLRLRPSRCERAP